MTIDEAIVRERQLAKEQKTKYDKCPTRMRYCCGMCFHNPKCNEIAEYNEQLVEWLEELVMLRLDSCMIHMPERLRLVENGYNKALDDFVNFAKSLPVVEEEDGTIRPMWLEEIAEQLKAGGENEQII